MDKETIQRLFEAYADDVFRLALSYLHNRQDAEDVCQGVFLKLLHKNVVLLPNKEKAYLLTCTANACKNHLQSYWVRNVGGLDENAVIEEESHQDVFRAIGALPKKYRGIVHLYYYEGYDQGEIARILGISRTAVQTRMSRARALLKKELCEDAEDLS